MIDKTLFKKYLIELNEISKRMLDNQVKRFSANVIFNNYITKWLDATRKTPDGKYQRTQTIDYIYKSNITECLYVIENYIKNKDACVITLLRRHNDNLLYEKENPPVIYDKNKVKPKRQKSSQKVDEASLPGFENPRRESAAERKLKEKVFKINALKFKI